MKYLAGLFAALLFVAGCSDSTLDSDAFANKPLEDGWTWVPYDSDLLRISGRTNYERGEFVILSWSASSITIAFVGTALELNARTNNNVYLDVFVDGEETPSSLILLTNSDLAAPSIVPVISGLPLDTHVVTLYKRSGSNFGDWYVYGMRVLGKAEKELLPPMPKRKIEFVGNSITCGDDVLVPVPGQDFELIYESSFYSYAGQTARILHAEEHNICSGGHGIYVNLNGSKALTLPVMYRKTSSISSSFVLWDHGQWHPDIVVINLGTNDFASGKNDSTMFIKKTVDFVRNIRSYHADAKIVLLDGPMLYGENLVKCRQYLDVAKATLEGEGIMGVYRFSFEPNQGFHPVKEKALVDAESLSVWIRSEFGWD